MLELYRGCDKMSARNVRTLVLALWFVMCEQVAMSNKPRTQELADRAGISKSYASEILSGSRVPKLPLAIHIMRSAGWRHPVLDDLTDEQIAVLETVDPWTPQDRAA